MRRKAEQGHVTGGRVFGYDNGVVHTPDGRRSHVERRINEREAAVIRRIFDLCASGTGLTRCAKLLNAEKAPTPMPRQGRPAAWAPSSIRSILFRRLYRSEIVWNQTKKRNVWGEHAQASRPELECIRVPAPHLRIVSDDVWNAAHGRLEGIRSRPLSRPGRPPPGAPRHRVALPAERLRPVRGVRPVWCSLVWRPTWSRLRTSWTA